MDGLDDGGHQIVQCPARRQRAAAEGVGIDLLFGAGQQHAMQIHHREVQYNVGGNGFEWRGVEIAGRNSLEGRRCTCGGGHLRGRGGKEDGEGQKHRSSFHNDLSSCLCQDSVAVERSAEGAGCSAGVGLGMGTALDFAPDEPGK